MSAFVKCGRITLVALMLTFGVAYLSGCGGGGGGSADHDPALVGSWRGMVGDSKLTLNANGTGKLEGEKITWKTENGYFIFSVGSETEKGKYEVSGNRFAVDVGGLVQVFVKK